MNKIFLPTVPILVASIVSCTANAEKAPEAPKEETKPNVVEQMRGMNMQGSPIGRSDGKPDPIQVKREKILTDLAAGGEKSIPALIKALKDKDVQMRRNACLTFINLATPMGTDRPKVNIVSALPDLIEATKDEDADVRAWAAHAIAEIGPEAKDAVPQLIELFKGKDEGARNNAAVALGSIGPDAKAALPVLKEALKNKSEDVRGLAEVTINRIEGKEIE